ncbi:MAG: hypothetical protein HZY76_02645 [Anaerolineae bacterium]|nr:MAG: hypothetical protein HZY76_02645 [Anaerolineae bacterium]
MSERSPCKPAPCRRRRRVWYSRSRRQCHNGVQPRTQCPGRALAEIYSDEASTRRLARDSGLSLGQIAFDAPDQHLVERSHRGRVPGQNRQAHRSRAKEYPAAPDLLAAVAAYRAGRVPAPASPSAPARPVPPSATPYRPTEAPYRPTEAPYRPTEAPYRPTDDEKRALAQALLQCDAMSSRSARRSWGVCRRRSASASSTGRMT